MASKIESLADLIALLELALSNPEERVSVIKEFQDYIWPKEAPILGATEEQWDYLHEFAGDLHYYEPNPVYRAEDSSFYDDQKLEFEIINALQKLRELAPNPSHKDIK